MEPWMKQRIDTQAAVHGTMPPPWVVHDEHPCSICWRMGSGESHLMAWWPWWRQQAFTEAQMVAYFRRWPPPYCWLEFLIEAVWGIDISDEMIDLGPYFARTEALGFGNRADFERDFEDPAWLE